ncbi:MAG: lytic murein transglycosylase [Pseudomonadota bacterium]
MSMKGLRSALAGTGAVLALAILAACTTSGGSSFPRVVSVTCGNGPAGFGAWKDAFAQEAISKGIDAGVVNASLSGLTYSTRVIALDRDQKAFKASFETFYARRVSDALVARGRRFIASNRALLDRIEGEFGVQPEVLVSILALESSFGQFQGNLSILRALATLAYDCRRQQFFSAELLDALRVIERGDLTARQMVGAWAGEYGMTQFLMSRYYAHAIDYDGSGRADLRRSFPDVLASTASVLRADGWRRGQPWTRGTANWRVIQTWNRADVYVETIATLAIALGR